MDVSPEHWRHAWGLMEDNRSINTKTTSQIIQIIIALALLKKYEIVLPSETINPSPLSEPQNLHPRVQIPFPSTSSAKSHSSPVLKSHSDQ
jgi:hypothetical protein